MEIQISTYDDLLQFINRTDVNFNIASQIVEKFLSILIIEIGSKELLIEAVEKYIVDYGNLTATAEKPIFLNMNIDVIE